MFELFLHLRHFEPYPRVWNFPPFVGHGIFEVVVIDVENGFHDGIRHGFRFERGSV